MTFADMSELEALVQKVAADESVTVLVIASDLPGYFVAHGDLGDLLRLGRGEPFAGDAGSWPGRSRSSRACRRWSSPRSTGRPGAVVWR
jgi:enoyl-CoA hydratase/carnithine racemase